MKNYTKNLTWAVVSMLDRSTQDDNKSKVQIAGLFANPVVAQDSFIPYLPNKEYKRYIVHVDDLEEFETVYNQFQDIHANMETMQYSTLKILALTVTKKINIVKYLRFTQVLIFSRNAPTFGASAGDGLPALIMADRRQYILGGNDHVYLLC